MYEKAQDGSYSTMQYEHTSKLIYINLLCASHDGIMKHKKIRMFKARNFFKAAQNSQM